MMPEREFPNTLKLDCGPVTAVDLSLYAAASGDHNPLHLDDSVALSAGFDRPIVHGMLSMAYVGRLLTETFGVGAVVFLHTRFTGIAKRGQTLMLQANLERTENDLGHYKITVLNEDGQELVVGVAHIRWPKLKHVK